MQPISSEKLNDEPSSTSKSSELPVSCVDPCSAGKILIDDDSYLVDQYLKPQQKHAQTQNHLYSVSIDAPHYKRQEYIVANSGQKEVDPSLPHEVEETLTVESSSENNTKEEETVQIEENYFGDGIDRSDDDFAYFRCFAIILHDVSEELLTSILGGSPSCVPTANKDSTPTANKDLFTIIENLELPLQVYSEHQENLTTMKLANMQVKRQYRRLKRVIDKLSDDKNSQISFDIPTDKFLDKPGLLEYMESRDIKNLMQAINKLNKNSARRGQCKLM